MVMLYTQRLILRNFRREDFADFHAYMSLHETARYENFDPLTPEESRELIEERIPLDNRLAVFCPAAGHVIGDVGFEELEFDTYVFSFDFHSAYGRRGYATEACRALAGHLFGTLNARRVFAECMDENLPSIRLLERLGFRREGTFLQDIAYKCDAAGHPIFVNSCYYAMLRHEWQVTVNR